MMAGPPDPDADGFTRGLSRWIASVEIDDTTLAAVLPALLDTVAVTLAGGAEPTVRRLAASYAVAASLADGRIDLGSFTDEAVLRPALQPRLLHVEGVQVPGAVLQGEANGNANVTVALTTGDGGILCRVRRSIR